MYTGANCCTLQWSGAADTQTDLREPWPLPAFPQGCNMLLASLTVLATWSARLAFRALALTWIGTRMATFWPLSRTSGPAFICGMRIPLSWPPWTQGSSEHQCSGDVTVSLMFWMWIDCLTNCRGAPWPGLCHSRGLVCRSLSYIYSFANCWTLTLMTCGGL